MKKMIVQLAVVASVALFALNNQAQAASLHISFGLGKDKVCCVHQPPRHQLRKHHKHQAHRHDMRMVLGAVIAVFSTNLKRTLACSSLSQIGFITVGVSMIALLGEENALAAHGTMVTVPSANRV